jgi:NAD(P)-dependent dehydrogenase (short-subunit alcohol dehydrogenase family)
MTATTSSKTMIIATGAAALAGAALLWKQRQRKHAPRDSLASLQGNSYATASDVLHIFPKAAEKKTIVITGTSSGLGNHVARLLGTRGKAHIIMGVRSPSAASIQELMADLQAAGGRVHCFAVDLASLDSVQQFASHVKQVLDAENKPLDILVNNAGVFGLHTTTQDGYPVTWQVNSMAPAFLTELLWSSFAPDGRVVNVSSEMHKYCRGRSLVDQCPPNAKLAASSSSAHYDYALSKACQIAHAHELNRRRQRGHNHIRAMAVEPGLVHTSIGRHMPQWMIQLEYALLGPFLFRSVDQGCATIVYCCLASLEELGDSDFYFANCAPCQPKAICASVEEAERLRTLFHGMWKDRLQPEQ